MKVVQSEFELECIECGHSTKYWEFNPSKDFCSKCNGGMRFPIHLPEDSEK